MTRPSGITDAAPSGLDLLVDGRLETLREAGLEREIPRVEPLPPLGRMGAKVGGREAVVFCSNDYLGLSTHPEVREAAARAAAGRAGSGASRLVTGDSEIHRELEERIRDFKGVEAVLLFNSGYHANLGAISTLAGRDTEIFSDRLNHASIVDACVLSRARVRRYPNRDVDALEGLLKKSASRKKLIVTDGVFSMDGTVAPLTEVAELARRYGAALYVDDAHGSGVLGENGRGTLEHLGVEDNDIIQMGTLGKAFGSFGAFVAGPRRVIDLLVSRARPFIFTTALPPSVCAAASKAVEVASSDPTLRKRCLANAERVRRGLNKMGLDTLGSATQIIPVLTGDPVETMSLTEKLLDRGVFIQGIRPPTVPEGTSRLRITVSTAHTDEDIGSALAKLADCTGRTR